MFLPISKNRSFFCSARIPFSVVAIAILIFSVAFSAIFYASHSEDTSHLEVGKSLRQLETFSEELRSELMVNSRKAAVNAIVSTQDKNDYQGMSIRASELFGSWLNSTFNRTRINAGRLINITVLNWYLQIMPAYSGYSVQGWALLKLYDKGSAQIMYPNLTFEYIIDYKETGGNPQTAPFSISGTILDNSTGLPVSDARASVIIPASMFYNENYTNSTGIFTIPTVSGTGKLEILHPSYEKAVLNVTISSNITGLVFRLNRRQSGQDFSTWYYQYNKLDNLTLIMIKNILNNSDSLRQLMDTDENSCVTSDEVHFYEIQIENSFKPPMNTSMLIKCDGISYNLYQMNFTVYNAENTSYSTAPLTLNYTYRGPINTGLNMTNNTHNISVYCPYSTNALAQKVIIQFALPFDLAFFSANLVVVSKEGQQIILTPSLTTAPGGEWVTLRVVF